METKVNVETNAEEREDVELFEQERRKEEEFKNKLEEQIDSLISQNEKEKSNMEHKHIAEEIHFDLKELFEICEDVICKESEWREDESSRGVLRLAKALIRNTSYSDGNHFDEEEQLYELADEYLSDFYDRNGIEELYEIDDAEY